MEEGDGSSSSSGLPQSYSVKYLGQRPAEGLWGIKYTRDPVDRMVAKVRAQKSGSPLPALTLTVTPTGVKIRCNSEEKLESLSSLFKIDSISYGVQDLVYTRVFAMIVVGKSDFEPEFQCYAFVCSSRSEARNLTYSLASAFTQFAEKTGPKRAAIDLRKHDSVDSDNEDSFDCSEA